MQRETLGHILGMCHHTKNKCITRHDEIKLFIAERQPQRFSTFIEPAVGVYLKQTDLITKNQNRLIVVDVTFRHENRTSQTDAHTEKARKYKQKTLNRRWAVRWRRSSTLTWAAKV